MQFLGKFGKIVCWRPLEGWRTHLGKILDPPLRRDRRLNVIPERQVHRGGGRRQGVRAAGSLRHATSGSGCGIDGRPNNIQR